MGNAPALLLGLSQKVYAVPLMESAMPYDFTPAAQRALESACRWGVGHPTGVVDATTLLFGLLSDEESRATHLLARWQVTMAAACKQWPEFRFFAGSTVPHGCKFSADIRVAMQAARQRLDEFPPSLIWSTEHVLLALACSSTEVCDWLSEHGISADLLTEEIYRLYGLSRGPLDFETPAECPAKSIVHQPFKSVENADQHCKPSSPQGQLPQATGLQHKLRKITDKHDFTSSESVARLRILDSNANRAREALRVIEDYFRFALDDGHLTELAKQVRHDLTRALAELPLSQRLAARETQQDVGTAISTIAEGQRSGNTDVVAASFARLSEALRSIEEYSKVEQPAVGATVEQLRYRAYTLHKAMEITSDSQQRLQAARFYVLIDGQASLDDFDHVAGSLVEAGVDVLQLRDKGLSDRELLARAKRLRNLTAGSRTLFVMNDRPDLALLAGADGVHVGQEELSVHNVRKIIGHSMLVGVSTHDIAQARQAVLDGANYLGVGPTFHSQTKDFAQFSGLDFVRAVAKEISLPAFAIGGINLNNVGQVVAAGLTRVAVSGAIRNASNPTAFTRSITAMLNE